MSPRLLLAMRSVAVAIAVAGAIDPEVTSTRRGRPTIAVLTADPAHDRELSDRTVRELSKRFTVVAVPTSGAAATVLVGNRLPSTRELASPVFAVLPSRDIPAVSLERVDAPGKAALSARTPVLAMARVTGAGGRTVRATLSLDGLVVDRVDQRVVSGDTLLPIALSCVPTVPGTVALRVRVSVDGGQDAAADLATEIEDPRWAVLFFDPRPSWMSTFTRRALERDPRFVVTSRVVTSRGISTDVGRPPELLDDVAALALFDVVVVGAPEALTDRQVSGLGDFLRRRGGSVLLLLDQQVDGPYRDLIEVSKWDTENIDGGVRIQPVTGDSGTLRSAEVAWPRSLPLGAVPIATAGTGKAMGAPLIWRSAVGAGRLLVSGALDAWRFRDDSTAGFDPFWRTVVADAAIAAVPALDVRVAPAVMTPGDSIEVRVTVRDAALAEAGAGAVRADVALRVDDSLASPSLRLWPDATVGAFRAVLRAPSTPGMHRVIVSSGVTRTTVPFIVAPTVTRAAPDDRAFVASWVAAHGGRAIEEAQLSSLPSALAQTLEPRTHRETWYPMRSAWWLLPFTLALGWEWWSRRRRGLP